MDADTPMAIWWRGTPEGTQQSPFIAICNDAYRNRLGIVSTCDEDTLPKISDRDTETASVARSVLATGKTSRHRYVLESASGKTQCFSVVFSPILDNSQVSGAFVSVQKTTLKERKGTLQSRKQREKSRLEAALEQNEQKAQRQIQNVLESISDAFIAFDRNWCYTYINRKAAQFLHQEKEDLIGQPVWSDAFPGKVGTLAYQELHKAMEDNVKVVFEDYSPSFDAWFEVHAYPSAEGLAIYFQDVSDRRKAEAAKAQRLAEEQAARKSAEAASRLKDEFLAVVSHELRSPLTPILGCAKLLKNADLGSERKEKAIASIERNALIQAQLISDLLDVSQILQGELTINTCSLPVSLAIKTAMKALEKEARSKNISIQTHFDAKANSVLADPARFQQIIWNLLSNAIKFTPHTGKVFISVEPSDRQVKIAIADTGKGIHSSFLPYVFDRFRQEDAATTRQFGGLGLGLAIVRHLVELQNGTVQASSPGEGQGATFTIFLPSGNLSEKKAKNGLLKQIINASSESATAESQKQVP